MSFTLAGINDRLSMFVDEQVDAILKQLTLLGNVQPQAWKIRSHEISESIKMSPEVKSLVQNVEKQLAKNILNARDNCMRSPGVVLNGENVSNDEIFQSKLERLPSVCSSAISEITGSLYTHPHDIVSTPSWSHTSVILKNCLFCNNYNLFKLSLQIHAKLTHSLASSAIKEGFLNLSRGLQMYYKKSYADRIINFNSGLDLQNPVHFYMIKICQLIVESVKILPKNWVRYGKRSVECVCETFLSLLVYHAYTPHTLVNGTKADECVYPFHIVSTLDPSAEWCVCWLHSTFGQSVLFITHTSLAKTLLQVCVDALLVYLSENPPMSNTIMFATFIHSASVLKAMLQYRDCQKLFPVMVLSRFGDHHLSFYDFSMLLARHIIKCVSCEDHRHQEVLNCLSSLFLSLVENFPGKIVDEELLRVLLEPICASYIGSHSGVQFTVRFLNSFLKSRTGVKVLWGVGHKRKLPSKSWHGFNASHSALGCRKSSVSSLGATSRQQSTKSLRVMMDEVAIICPARMIIQFTTAALKKSPSHSLLEPLLSVCGSLLELHEGVLHLCETDCVLLSVAAGAYRQLSGSQYVPQLRDASPTFISDVPRNLLAFFMRVSWTPRGAFLLSNERDVVLKAVQAGMSDPTACWEDARFRLVTAQLLFVHKGRESVTSESSRAVTHAMDRLRVVHEDPETLTGSERGFNAAMQYFINIVHTLASTVEDVANLLTTTDDGSSVDTLVDSDGPSSFFELLTSDSLTEEWHYIALLVLQLLVTNLNTLLYLSHKLNLQSCLLQLQQDNLSKHHQPSTVIVDRCSLLRHRVLVSSHVVGGPGERELAGPMFVSLPSPHTLYCRPKPCSKTRTPLHRFLKDTETGLHDMGWVINARKAYMSSAHCDLKPSVVLGVVEQLARCCSAPAARAEDWSAVQAGELFPEDTHGVQLAVRYGVNCGLLQPSAQNADNLSLVVRKCYRCREPPTSFSGFPWFLATAFNLCGGSLDRCYSFLSDVRSLPASEYLQPRDSASERDVMFGHLLEHIVSTELPLAFNALQMGGVCWWHVCHEWMAQCFWNILDWPQICHWLVVSLLYPLDYMLYWRVALLRHAQPQILTASAEENLVDCIKLEVASGFRISNHLAFMEQLAKSYRTLVLQHLQEL